MSEGLEQQDLPIAIRGADADNLASMPEDRPVVDCLCISLFRLQHQQ